jgi:alkylation response protein AidB-like acyl-CoA dehydrogenase
VDFGLSDAQVMLRQSVRDLLAREAPIDRVRRVMESDDGVDRAIHRALGDQGIAGLLVPEEHGGAGLGLLDAVVAAQELARGAAPVSFHASYVMAPLLIAAAGSEQQKREWLPRIAGGSALVAVVLDERAHDGAATATHSSEPPLQLDAGALRGSVGYVPDATVADVLLVEVGGSLVLVPRDATRLRIEPLRTVDDTRRLGELLCDGVALAEVERLPGSPDGAAVAARALQAGRVALAADALGAALEGLRIAVEYAKQREQFNQVIGSFQAVKHMCAETAAALDPIQSLLWYTAYAWDQKLEEARHLAPLLKAHATEAATDAVTTCTQVFGGIGFTWECDMHLYFKRAGYDRQVLGAPTELFALAAAIEHPARSRATAVQSAAGGR